MDRYEWMSSGESVVSRYSKQYFSDGVRDFNRIRCRYNAVYIRLSSRRFLKYDQDHKSFLTWERTAEQTKLPDSGGSADLPDKLKIISLKLLKTICFSC